MSITRETLEELMISFSFGCYTTEDLNFCQSIKENIDNNKSYFFNFEADKEFFTQIVYRKFETINNDNEKNLDNPPQNTESNIKELNDSKKNIMDSSSMSKEEEQKSIKCSSYLLINISSQEEKDYAVYNVTNIRSASNVSVHSKESNSDKENETKEQEYYIVNKSENKELDDDKHITSIKQSTNYKDVLSFMIAIKENQKSIFKLLEKLTFDTCEKVAKRIKIKQIYEDVQKQSLSQTLKAEEIKELSLLYYINREKIEINIIQKCLKNYEYKNDFIKYIQKQNVPKFSELIKKIQ